MSMSLPPGFRFNPTDEELVFYYLRNRIDSVQCAVPPVPVVIADVDIYKFDPWDLPSQAVYGDREWYFFSPRDRKYPNGTRPNRAAGSGYWKSTGTDKPVLGGEGVGIKKALAFYKGRPPKGTKTSWIMHEYRLATTTNPLGTDKPIKFCNVSTRLDDWVLCRIYKKTSKVSLMVSPSLSVSDYECYDPTVNYDDMCGGGGSSNAPPLFAPSSSSCTYQTIITRKQQPQTGSAAQTGGLPKDLYAAEQIFYNEAEHPAVHPSLNELLSGCDSIMHVEPSYYVRSLSPAAIEAWGRK